MRIRILLVLLLFVFFYFAILSRLFYWQVLRSPEIQKISASQSTESIVLQARRGDILAKDEFPLATSKSTYLLYANPKTIKEKDSYVGKLSEILSADKASISAQLSEDLFWVKLANGIDVNMKARIESLKLSGLGFQENNTRYYPESSMAAQLIGFLGKDDRGNDKGYFGIEGFYDSQLSGRDGKLYAIHDALGNSILNDIREEKKIDGRSLLLSIDRTAQYIVEKKLKEGIDKYQAEGGSVIVMEPSTGKILAMASLPRFNPQQYYKDDYNTYKNPVISNIYEPGSTFKVLIMSAALDKNLIKPDTRCNICSGPVEIGEYKIKTWNDKYYPNSTMTEVIQHSDNTGMVFVSMKLGISNMIEYLKKFGIGEYTGIDLQGEVSLPLKSENKWYPIDVATLSFGQGISITPLQLLTAVSAIANKGQLMKPYVVTQIVTEDGKKIEIKPQVRNQVISETTAQVMKEIMVNAVDKGESKWTKVPNYKIAGKTGTAQIPIAGHYDPEKTIASFIGFFPADDPKISMFVMVDRPKTSIYGSETAAPIFFSIARDLINYYNIPPSF